MNLSNDALADLFKYLTHDDLLSYRLMSKGSYNITENAEFLALYTHLKYGVILEKLDRGINWDALTYLESLIVSAEESISNVDDIISILQEVDVYSLQYPEFTAMIFRILFPVDGSVFEYDLRSWDPFDNPDDDQYEIDSRIGVVAEIATVSLYYEDFEDIILTITNFRSLYDIGDIHWFNDALRKAMDLDDPRYANLLMAYTIPYQIIDIMKNKETIPAMVARYPELSWILLSEGMQDKYLREVLPTTRRYNRRNDLQYYKCKVNIVIKYASHQRQLIDAYWMKIDLLRLLTK